MRTRFLPALLLPALLAACQNGTPNSPDPLTLDFTATGASRNYTPTQDLQLSYTTQNQKLVIGTLKSGGTVDVLMTAAQAKSVTMRQLTEYANAWKDGGCDVTALNVQNTPLRFTDLATFTSPAGTPSVLYPQTVTKNADGSATTARVGFYYAVNAGSMKGAVTCLGRSAVTYDIILKPGWNTVTHTVTTKLDGQYVEDRFDQSTHTNRYDGPWYAYTAPK